MTTKLLSDRMLASLPVGITYDTKVSGFGCRTTPARTQSFILEYRTRSQRKRRSTIGRAGDWSVWGGPCRSQGAEAKDRRRQGSDGRGSR